MVFVTLNQAHVAQQIEVDITTENGTRISPFSYLTITQQFNGPILLNLDLTMMC